MSVGFLACTSCSQYNHKENSKPEETKSPKGPVRQINPSSTVFLTKYLIYGWYNDIYGLPRWWNVWRLHHYPLHTFSPPLSQLNRNLVYDSSFARHNTNRWCLSTLRQSSEGSGAEQARKKVPETSTELWLSTAELGRHVDKLLFELANRKRRREGKKKRFKKTSPA